jgi:hypothetical protein
VSTLARQSIDMGVVADVNRCRVERRTLTLRKCHRLFNEFVARAERYSGAFAGRGKDAPS